MTKANMAAVASIKGMKQGADRQDGDKPKTPEMIPEPPRPLIRELPPADSVPGRRAR